MTVTAQIRGNKIKAEDGKHWKYKGIDVNQIKKFTCTRCMVKHKDNDYDHCLGHIPGVRAACCGHGVEEGYILFQGLLILERFLGEIFSYRIISVKFSRLARINYKVYTIIKKHKGRKVICPKLKSKYHVSVLRRTVRKYLWEISHNKD